MCSRWPWQKTVALDLDAIQCQMIAKLMKLPRTPEESLDGYCRRRLRSARALACDVGLWSLQWARRVCTWQEHFSRAGMRNHIFRLLELRGVRFLQQCRSRYVVTNGTQQSRNTLFAGRTGTRVLGSRPQMRWCEGAILAKSLRHVRCEDVKNKSARTVALMYSELAHGSSRQVFENYCTAFGGTGSGIGGAAGSSDGPNP